MAGLSPPVPLSVMGVAVAVMPVAQPLLHQRLRGAEPPPEPCQEGGGGRRKGPQDQKSLY